MNTETRVKVPFQRLAATFAAGSANSDSRTADLTFYTGAAVRRWSWDKGEYNLSFSMKPEHVRLGRLNSGAPLLDSHMDMKLANILGVIERGWLEGGKGKATVRFSKRDEVEPILQDVLDGIITSCSMGVAIYKVRETTGKDDSLKSFLAVDWEPQEISLVACPADAGAGFKAAAEQFTECEIELLGATAPGDEQTMTNTQHQTGAAPDQNKDAEAIRSLLKNQTVSGLPDAASVAEELIARGASLTEARAEFLNRLVADQEKTPTRGHWANPTLGEQAQTLTARMSEALACRYTGKAPSDGAREFMGARITDMAREICRARGLSTPYNAGQLVELALHSTTDFPNLVTGTGHRILLDAYQASEAPIKRVCRRATVNDFRNKNVLRIGEAPELLKVPEGGEITYGTRAESKEAYRAYTYARIFGITREALVNDDLSAFSDFARAWGVAAANKEADIIVALLASNPTLATDSTALFHSTHANLTDPGTAISIDSFTVARKAMRSTKGLDGSTLIEVAPRYLVVPAEKETVAEQYLAQLYPAQAANANPFSGKLELIVEPRLDAYSTIAWYIFGDPSVAPVLEYAYLAGAEGPQVSSREGFEVLGMEFRAVLDFGAGALNYRGAYKNLGA